VGDRSRARVLGAGLDWAAADAVVEIVNGQCFELLTMPLEKPVADVARRKCIVRHAFDNTSSSALLTLAISSCPRQNLTKPVPVPEKVTVTAVPLLAFMNSCATASASGKAVLDPSRTMASDGARSWHAARRVIARTRESARVIRAC